MVLARRVVMTTLIACAVWLLGAPAAAADSSLVTPQFATVAVSADGHTLADGQPAESAGPAIPRQILYAGVGGLAVGGVIAFWQSRKRRRNDVGRPDDERER